jgi:hypothetical protein
MVNVLDELKTRQTEAAKKLQEATADFQHAQARLQAAQQEANIWTGAVQVETRAQEQRRPAPMVLEAAPAAPAPAETANQSSSSDVNKTEVVRDLLRHRPTGMTPAELWHEVKGQMTHAYLYSILKRLKDRDQVCVKRKKYCLRTMISKTEDGKQNVTLPLQ